MITPAIFFSDNLYIVALPIKEKQMNSNQAIRWDKLAIEENYYKRDRKPGISVISNKESTIINNKTLSNKDLSSVLTIKAIFGGTIIS